MEAFTGEIKLVTFTYETPDWMFCNGQILATSSFPALFSLIGDRFGGNGRSTFALPDLRGRVPVHAGQGPGLTSRIFSQKIGEETITLDASNIPAHSHLFKVGPLQMTGLIEPECYVGFAGDQTSPEGNYPGPSPAGMNIYSSVPNKTMGPFPVTLSMSNSQTSVTEDYGGGLDHDNMQPSLVLNYMICVDGIYPPHS